MVPVPVGSLARADGSEKPRAVVAAFFRDFGAENFAEKYHFLSFFAKPLFQFKDNIAFKCYAPPSKLPAPIQNFVVDGKVCGSSNDLGLVVFWYNEGPGIREFYANAACGSLTSWPKLTAGAVKG
jgi:hypothetical protein